MVEDWVIYDFSRVYVTVDGPLARIGGDFLFSKKMFATARLPLAGPSGGGIWILRRVESALLG